MRFGTVLFAVEASFRVGIWMVSNGRKGNAVEIRERSKYGYCRICGKDSAKFCKKGKCRHISENANKCLLHLLTNKCLRDILCTQGTRNTLKGGRSHGDNQIDRYQRYVVLFYFGIYRRTNVPFWRSEGLRWHA